ncbi:hypothetical protein FRC02_006170 [Tulasnella sp. 418]|nr:hypothetical protein FRC02_006170 [Tulasnella sp. 418]
MPFSLDIIPHIPSLDMYGSPKPHTAYSLSGEIVLTLTSPPSSSQSIFFNPSASNTASSSTAPFRPSTIYLASLLVTFEGKVELISSNCAYTANRLVQVSKELVTGNKPLILTNKGVRKLSKDDAPEGTMRWSMTFDLAVPGWVPPSTSVPDGSVTSYAVFASAKFAEDMDSALSAMTSQPSTSTSSSLSSYIPAPLLSLNPFSRNNKVKAASATPVPIKVNRFRSPKSLNPFMGTVDLTTPLVPPQIPHPTPSMFPVTLESVETRICLPPPDSVADREKRIPIDFLAGIEIVAGIPEFVSMSEDKIPLSLRIRSNNCEEINNGLVLEAFDVEVEQTEKFRSVPCERYIQAFPVPPASEQPPNKPLLNPNPLEQFQNLGLTGEAASQAAVQWTRTVPLISTKRVNFRPSPATGGLEIDGEWAKMDLGITVLRKSDMESEPETPEAQTPEEAEKLKKEREERAGRNLRRTLISSDFDSPLSKVRHDMKISLKLSWLPENVAEEINELIRIVEVTCGPGSLGEKKRKLRMSHPARKTETLMLNLSVRLVEVSEQVEAVYMARQLGQASVAPTTFVRGAPLIRPLTRSALPSRSASPAISEASNASTSSQPSLRRSNSYASTSSPGSWCIGLPSRTNSPAPPVPSFHFALPPYSELYHTNGERKECENIWLPKYEEKDTNAFALPDELEYSGPIDFGF